MNKKTLLIVDDEENMRHMLKAMLSRYSYSIYLSENGLDASSMIREIEFDFILCDIRMPKMDGLEFLQSNADILKSTTVIMMSAYGSVDLALEAMKKGAYDFISKPFKTDEVLLTLKKAEERELLKRENIRLKKMLGRRNDGFKNIIGHSNKIKSVIELAEKVAQYNTTVLVTGESGTGKELIARGIHSSSPRASKPFFAINCGSIPGDLLESEFFGYLRGAFTGAERNKKGLFEEADGSTLFLDEIGELPLTMQVKLLRVLQEGEIRPVGASSVKKIDVRVLAATAKNLQHEVERGFFRDDLYYRLNVLSLKMPSLRERVDDIPNLCNHFINKYNYSLKRSVEGVGTEAMDILLRYQWPGNIRELENVIQRGIVLTVDNTIELDHIPQSIAIDPKEVMKENIAYQGFSMKKAQKNLEENMIKKALDETDGNKSKAAVLLEISYPSLLSKIKEYSL